MGNEVPLASASNAKAIVVDKNPPTNIEERIRWLEARLSAVQEAFAVTRSALINKENTEPTSNAYDDVDKNHEGLPLSTCLIGVTKGVPYVLTVWKDGKYYIGNKEFTSLSAAAQHVSGVRRSGWTFWKLPDGRTVKEVFKDKHG